MCFTMKEQHSWLHINAVTFVTQVPFTSVQIPSHAPYLLSQKENLLQCLDNLVKTYNCSNPLKIWCKLHTGKSETISVQIKLWFSRDTTQHPKESISQQHFHAHAVSLYKMPNHRITINGKFQIWEHTANTQKKNLNKQSVSLYTPAQSLLEQALPETSTNTFFGGVNLQQRTPFKNRHVQRGVGALTSQTSTQSDKDYCSKVSQVVRPNWHKTKA